MSDNDGIDYTHSLYLKDLRCKYNLKSGDRNFPKSSIDESFDNCDSNSTRGESDRSYKMKIKKVSFNSLVKIVNIESYKKMNRNENLKNLYTVKKTNKKEIKNKVQENRKYKEQKCINQCEIF